MTLTLGSLLIVGILKLARLPIPRTPSGDLSDSVESLQSRPDRTATAKEKIILFYYSCFSFKIGLQDRKN